MKYTVTKALYLGGTRYMPGQSIELDPKMARRFKHLLKTNSNSMPEKETPVEAPKKEKDAPAEVEDKAVEGAEDKQMKKAKKK